MTNLPKIISQLVKVARLSYKRGLICGTEGNFSIKVNANLILTTPKGICKGFLKPSDLVLVDLQGNRVKGLNKNNYRPSSEMDMHLCVYETRADANAVLHAHPTTLVAFTVSGLTLDYKILPEIITTFKTIPVAQYATPGTSEVRQSIQEIIKTNDLVVLDHHGIIMLGDNILDLFYKLEMLEHYAKTLLIAKILGEPQNLSNSAIEKLIMS